MGTEKTVFDSGVIEVPPELRGPSNEEILQKEGREDTPRRRRAAARPSKRERMDKKLGISRAEMSKIAGLEELIFDNPEDYTKKAVELAFDKSRLENLRKKIRPENLTDTGESVKNFYNALGKLFEI